VEELTGLGAEKLALLVIPNHHGRGHVSEDANLCEWLRGLSAQGYEMVAHGYFHRRERRDGEGAMQRLTTQVYTADEGEFYDIEQEPARALVCRANTELREVGLEPRGFIAPAWLLSEAGERALCGLGCEYTTRLRTVVDLQTGRTVVSQSLCWSVRAAWRRVVSLAWNALLFRRLRGSPLMRIAVHPVDIEHAAIWRQIRTLVSAALELRQPKTYLDWIRAERQARGEAAEREVRETTV
jgi:hypothetical protein